MRMGSTGGALPAQKFSLGAGVSVAVGAYPSSAASHPRCRHAMRHGENKVPQRGPGRHRDRSTSAWGGEPFSGALFAAVGVVGAARSRKWVRRAGRFLTFRGFDEFSEGVARSRLILLGGRYGSRRTLRISGRFHEGLERIGPLCNRGFWCNVGCSRVGRGRSQRRRGLDFFERTFAVTNIPKIFGIVLGRLSDHDQQEQ